jgi:hypothetical protein
VWNERERVEGGKWYHLRLTHKMPEQRTWNARHQGNTESTHTGLCAYRAYLGKYNVEVQNVYHGKLSYVPEILPVKYLKNYKPPPPKIFQYIFVNALHKGDDE